MATHSSIFAWRLPWTEEPGGVQVGYSPWDRNESDMTECQHVRAHTHTHTHTQNKPHSLRPGQLY